MLHTLYGQAMKHDCQFFGELVVRSFEGREGLSLCSLRSRLWLAVYCRHEQLHTHF